jgi:hypothetical protein
MHIVNGDVMVNRVEVVAALGTGLPPSLGLEHGLSNLGTSRLDCGV